MVENWALELLLVFAVAFLLWFLLRWRKRSRCGAAQRNRDEIALTNQPIQTAKTTRPYVFETKAEPDEGLSDAGCYGYGVPYLSEMLGKIHLEKKEKDPDYIRGISVFSMSAVANIGKLATGAYAYPVVEGWEERTQDNVLVRSLSWNWVNETAPDVVKIVLTGVEMKRKRSSPTLQFSISWSTKFSDTFTEATVQDPKIFYISKRISSVMKQDVTHLCAKITYKTAFSKTGTIEFTPKPLKDIDPKKADTWTSKDGSVILHVTLSTLKFSTLCPDPSKKSMTSECECKSRWDTCVPVFEMVDWHKASELGILEVLNFETCVYIDNQKTSTQCYIFRLVGTKTVAIAFRGTQTDRIYDSCVDTIRDIECWQRPYDFDPEDPCILDLNPVIDTLHLRVHRGFFTGYLSVRDIVLETVYQMTEGWNSDWSIVVTGHSLGASIAILCGTELANRTLNKKRPNVSSLLLAPVRTGHESFVEFYKKSIPCSYRVVNQIDFIGTICMEYLYDHVPYEIHCLDRVKWTYSLPDSPYCEREVKDIIVGQIKPLLLQHIETVGKEYCELPSGLEEHFPGSYLHCVWQILKSLRGVSTYFPPQIQDVLNEEP